MSSAWQQITAALAGILTTAVVVLGPKAIRAAGAWLDRVGGGGSNVVVAGPAMPVEGYQHPQDPPYDQETARPPTISPEPSTPPAGTKARPEPPGLL